MGAIRTATVARGHSHRTDHGVVKTDVLERPKITKAGYYLYRMFPTFTFSELCQLNSHSNAKDPFFSVEDHFLIFHL